MSTIRLHVGGLPDQITDQELLQRFQPFGKVSESVVIRNAQGGCKGFGYVTIEGGDEVLKKCTAVLNNAKWRGRVLRISKAKEDYLSKLYKEWEAPEKQPEKEAAPSPTKEIKVKKAFLWKRAKGGRSLPVMHITKPNGKIMLVDPSKLKDNITILDDMVDAKSNPISKLTWSYAETKATPPPVLLQRQTAKQTDEIAEGLRAEKQKSLALLASMGLGREEQQAHGLDVSDSIAVKSPVTQDQQDSVNETTESSDEEANGGDVDDASDIIDVDQVDEEHEKEMEDAEEANKEHDTSSNQEYRKPQRLDSSADVVPLLELQQGDVVVHEQDIGSSSSKKAKTYQVNVPSLRALLRPDESFSLLGALATPEVNHVEHSSKERRPIAKRKAPAPSLPVPAERKEVEQVYFFKSHNDDAGGDFWINVTTATAKEQWEKEKSHFTLDYKKKHKSATKRIARFVQRVVTK